MAILSFNLMNNKLICHYDKFCGVVCMFDRYAKESYKTINNQKDVTESTDKIYCKVVKL